MRYLVARHNGPMRVQELAQTVGASAAYLAKIIHMLARKEFLEMTKGRGGGITAPRAAQDPECRLPPVLGRARPYQVTRLTLVSELN